jgi:Phage integrase, N-terminal SAM-like domain
LAYRRLTTGVAARRGYGEDSIYWHAAKGRYIGAISLGYDPKGKRIRKSVTGQTKAEVRDKLKELHHELEEGTASSPTYRVRQAVAAWLDSLDLDPSTVANYRFMAKHVINGLGNRRLRDLTAKEVQEFLEGLPLSTRSRKLVHKVLRDSIQHVMIAGMAGRNVAAVVNYTPRGGAGRPSKALSVAQAEAIIKAAKGTRLEAYLALSLMTGIRTEEARALTWEHLDLDGDPAADPPVPPHLAVWRSVRAHSDTKTERSKRTWHCRSSSPMASGSTGPGRPRSGCWPGRGGRSTISSSPARSVRRAAPATCAVTSGPSARKLALGKSGVRGSCGTRS